MLDKAESVDLSVRLIFINNGLPLILNKYITWDAWPDIITMFKAIRK